MKNVSQFSKIGAVALSAFLASAAASQAATITTFTDSSGIDLSGTYDSAINLGGTWNQAAVTIDQATFIDYRLAGPSLTIVHGGNTLVSPYYETAPVYAPVDAPLSLVTHGFVATWGGTPSTLGISVEGLTAGHTYEVQMIFSENIYKTANARSFDISVEGSLLYDDFTPIPAAADWSADAAPHTGVVVTHQFVAGDTTLNMDLSQGGTGDGTPYMNGFTLETVAVPEPSSFALIGGMLALCSVMVRRRKA